MITSKATARKQLPKIHKILADMADPDNRIRVFDIGCGMDEKFSEFCEKNNIGYLGYDPHHKTKLHNEVCLELINRHSADVVTISNVLNVIEKRKDRLNVLKLAKDSINADKGGAVFITVYEGSRLSGESKDAPMKPRKTRDGWQNRQPLEWYLEDCHHVFGCNVSVRKQNGVKFIMAWV